MLVILVYVRAVLSFISFVTWCALRGRRGFIAIALSLHVHFPRPVVVGTIKNDLNEKKKMRYQ
jgi:hypothetical protein